MLDMPLQYPPSGVAVDDKDDSVLVFDLPHRSTTTLFYNNLIESIRIGWIEWLEECACLTHSTLIEEAGLAIHVLAVIIAGVNITEVMYEAFRFQFLSRSFQVN